MSIPAAVRARCNAGELAVLLVLVQAVTPCDEDAMLSALWARPGWAGPHARMMLPMVLSGLTRKLRGSPLALFSSADAGTKSWLVSRALPPASSSQRVTQETTGEMLKALRTDA